MRKFTFFLALVMLAATNLAAQTILIPYGSTWKYLDDGSDQGTAWRATTFDDASWKSGPAILGYGNPPYNNRGEATVVKQGPYTTYFRKSITLASVAESFQFSVKRDDGVVVYVNGVEVKRNSMPGGTISYNTPALFSLDNGMVPQVFTVPGSAFVTGTNVIAVEIHQLKSPDSDMTFDLELVATGDTPPGDVTPPTVLSLNRHTPATETTSATSVTFRTIFSEAVTGVDATDFLKVGTANGTISGLAAVNSSTYDVTVSGISSNGTVGVNLKSSGTGIADAAANPISGGFTGQTYTIDQTPVDATPPTVLSLNRHIPSTENTNATSVTFRATFSEAVTGVDATDFLKVGTANGTISGVAAVNSTTYDVTVNGITINGTVGLNLKATGTGIADAAANPISGGFTGQTYTVDQAVPTVLSLNRHTPTTETTNATSVTFRTIFSEAVTGVDATDFLKVGTSNGTISGVVAVSGTTYDVIVNGISGSGSLGLNLKSSGTGIADAAANPISGGFTGQTYTVDQTPADVTAPTVLSLNRYTPATETTNATSVTFRTIFSEAVTGVDATDFLKVGTSNGTISGVVAVSGTTYDITVNGISGSGSLGLNLKSSGTGIADAAANPISGGFTGQTYTVDQAVPTVLSLNRHTPTTETTNATSVTFRTIFSEAVTGVDATDFLKVGTANGTISGLVAVSSTTYDVTVSGISSNGTVGLNLKASGTGIADATANPISSGFTGQTYTIDQAAPTALSINRQSPTTESTSNTSVIFRATFSEAVTGVDVTDFQKAGTAGGTVASVAAVSAAIYDVTVNNISGSGSLGLDLKSSGTGIADAVNNPISGGFTGQTYTIPPPPSTTVGFASVTNLNPITSRSDASKGRPQAKVFSNAGKYWAIIAATGGTYLWRLDGNNWTQIMRLSTRNARADCIVQGNVTHIFLFLGENSELFSVEYDPTTGTYLPWNRRRTKVDLVLDDGIETGTIALDGTGRMWLASDAITDINVRYSDAPYTSWSGPITLAAGVDDDDISAIVAMPNTGKIGVLWSNQTTQRFGFRTHADGTSPTSWTADEVPAAQSALIQGKGMADDHLDMKITSNGTLFCAVKTGYDKAGFPEIALLVRRPTGTWDDLHKVSENGTAPIVLVNEALDKVKVVYTSATYGGNILYKETSMSTISFSPELTLISGISNYASSTHYTYNSDIVILASNTEQTVGVLASDVAASSPALTEVGASLASALSGVGSTLTTTLTSAQAPAPEINEVQEELLAYPNPILTTETIRFALKTDGPYTLTVYDSKMGQVVYQKQGTARAGEQQKIEVAGARLGRGLYFARLQTNKSSKTLRLLVKQ